MSVGRSSSHETSAVDLDDEILRFDAIHQMPKPIQEGGVPIWVGGTVQPRMLRRLAAFGSGWIPWGPAAADLATHIPMVKHWRVSMSVRPASAIAGGRLGDPAADEDRLAALVATFRDSF